MSDVPNECPREFQHCDPERHGCNTKNINKYCHLQKTIIQKFVNEGMKKGDVELDNDPEECGSCDKKFYCTWQLIDRGGWKEEGPTFGDFRRQGTVHREGHPHRYHAIRYTIYGVGCGVVLAACRCGKRYRVREKDLEEEGTAIEFGGARPNVPLG